MAISIAQIWIRIEKVCQEHVPPPDLSFNPPASENEIEELEGKLNLTLPEDFKESLQIHNGMERFITGELLSTSRIYGEWKVWTDLLDEGVFDNDLTDNDSTVQKCWWSRKWVPIVADGGGNGECLDLDPGETGIWGQVIYMDHEDGVRPGLGKSFGDWLEGIATKLEKGELSYTSVYGET